MNNNHNVSPGNELGMSDSKSELELLLELCESTSQTGEPSPQMAHVLSILESITGGSSQTTGFNFCSHVLNGRKFSTLNDSEIEQLTSLRNEGRKDGFVVSIQPVDETPELQLERYLASGWESEIEIYKRVPSIVVICKISGLSALAGAGNKMFLNMDYLSCGTETDDQDCQH